MTPKQILQRVEGVEKSGGGWTARCPAHDDQNASLSIGIGEDGRILLHCHAGCSAEAIVEALGLTLADLFPPQAEARRERKAKIVADYDYHDEDGALLFQCVRYEPKDFRQRRPDPAKPGKWIWNLKSVPRVVYRLPEVKSALAAKRTIFASEGEKDCDALANHGFVATCNPMGAGKWLPEHTETLRGAARVVVIADKDKPGREHAQVVARALRGVVKSVKLIELPDRDGKPVKDAGDWFAAGGTAPELRAIVKAAPEFMPEPEAPTCNPAENEKRQNADAELVRCYGQPIFFRAGGVICGLNERFFAGRFHGEGRILFEPGERAFYEYSPDSGLWRRVSDDHVREELSAHVLNYGRRNEIILESKLTTARMGAVLQSLRGISEKREAFTRRTDFVHVGNGVIRFGDDGRVALSDFQSTDYSRNRCPVPFDPSADCPRFLNAFLRPALPDDDIDLLQRWAGLALVGINPAQRLVILDGAAATGKSTFARIMQKIVGLDNCAQLRTDLLFERFEIFRFVGKTLLLAPDTPGDFLNRPAASVLKSLVGGDPLSAEAKGSNQVFTLSGNFNVLITSNSRLRVRLDGDAGAWRRRLVIIRFEKPPPLRRIPNLAETLVAEEGPGILRWALAGYVAARKEIAELGDLFLSAEQQARVDALLSESDSLRRFIRECTEPGAGNATTSELTEGYFRFCSDRDWTPQPARTVERILNDILLETYGVSRSHDIRRNGHALRGWRGVRLKTDHPDTGNKPTLTCLNSTSQPR